MLLATLMLSALAVAGPAGPGAPEAPATDIVTAWERWPHHRFVALPAPCLTPAMLAAALRDLAAAHPGTVQLEVVGRSVESRPIHLLTVGHGPRRVLLWSQMHGDEPSATPALLDLVHGLLAPDADADDRRILAETTLLLVPMLNPDGSQRGKRRNAQGIDVNRDALNLATPEGRLLKALRDRYSPEMGFNLHDQDRRTTIARTGTQATLSLLAVAGDELGTLTPGRLQARRVASAIVEALRPLVGSAIARYDEDWSPRAFGDNLTAWGTPVVLIENGGPPPPDTPAGEAARGGGAAVYETHTRLVALALQRALLAFTEQGAAAHDPGLYESLNRNAQGAFSDVIVRGGSVVPPANEAFRADVAFDVEDDDARRAGCPGALSGTSEIVETGDARFLFTAHEVPAAGHLVLPGFLVSVRGRVPWLKASALDTLGALGVARVRWHVRTGDAARRAAEISSWAAPGRPRVEIVEWDATLRGLRLVRAPLPSPERTLRAAVRTLSAAARTATDERTVLARLREPSGDGASLLASPLVPGAPADFMVMRPGAGGADDLLGGTLVHVFIDGRVPSGWSLAAP